ncbi:RNA 2',3'-cyclic phosphodiesterase [Desulfobacter hydrogenophilus]|uniref:RNA 2',3'-cyclic phosphodiesterase n=1 Tax=Desulfobacter hydrogenophilus TaxID=2291 RepID=UPI0013CF5311|nr:RNA 2',3'-cyclic phosphodiesterase [Desulfobacter hydrogenophilus]NDY74013.1 RNA 2',3'-cyclic phosphodiesterase [Desulfobacter hydrogenophilus]
MNSDKNIEDGATIRCFIAIVLDGHTKRQLGRVQRDIRSTGIPAGWPSTQNFHLTLKFLGNISKRALPCIKTMLSEAIADKARFNITFNRLGIFPNVHHPKVLWIGPDKTNPKEVALQRDIDLRLNKCHPFVKEKRFSPHITLSRVRHYVKPGTLKKALKIETGTIKIPVNQVHLIKSQLYSSGAVHSSLFHANLKSS